jgi:hypothetical protein
MEQRISSMLDKPESSLPAVPGPCHLFIKARQVTNKVQNTQLSWSCSEIPI